MALDLEKRRLDPTPRRSSRALPLRALGRGAESRRRPWLDAAFEPDGAWDGKTRRIGVNARLLDAFDAASAPVKVLDGKNLW